MSVPVRSTLRSTLLWAVVPAAIVYAVALVWSGAEGLGPVLQGAFGRRFPFQRGLSALDGGGGHCLVCGVTRQIQGSVLNR